jgi:hypothetical protein
MSEDHRFLLQVEIVSAWFDRHGIDKGLAQGRIVARIGADNASQIDAVLLAETQQQPPFGGQANTVAQFAEIVAVR